MTATPAAHLLVPLPDDLPGDGWLAWDEPVSTASSAPAELVDCVGPDFPTAAELVDSAASAHFVRPPRQLVHGLALVFTSAATRRRAEQALRRASFAHCLATAVASDLAGDPTAAEVLAVDVAEVPGGHRATFTGASAAGVRPVHLDIVVVAEGPAVAVLWFGDTPQPFPAGDRRRVVERVGQRFPG